MLASPQRCDREVRCETGAAPATVSGEPAATATGLVSSGMGREGAAGDDPEPGDLRIAPLNGGTTRHDSSGGGGAFVVIPCGEIAPADPGPGRRALGQEPLCRAPRRSRGGGRHLLR